MDFKVIFQDSFAEDLEQIVKLIAVHNPSAALQLGDLIIRTAEFEFFSGTSPQGSSTAGRPTIYRKEAFQDFLSGAAPIGNC